MRIGTGRSCEMKWPWQLGWQMVPQSAYRWLRMEVAINLVFSHGKVTYQNDSVQKFYNSLLTIFIHTASTESLRLVQNVYSKWLTHPFWHFSSSAEDFLPLLSRVRRLSVRWCASKFWRPPSQFVRYSVEREMRYNRWDSLKAFVSLWCHSITS